MQPPLPVDTGQLALRTHTTLCGAPQCPHNGRSAPITGDVQVINLPELYKAANGSCCVPRSVLGDYTPLVRMDGSGGKFYATADPDCKRSIEASAYPTMYQAIWMCGKCEGGKCTRADGGAAASIGGSLQCGCGRLRASELSWLHAARGVRE